MSEVKFTKGLWVITEGDYTGLDCEITSDERRQCGKLSICGLDVYFGDESLEDEQKANARLIEKAPEMYEMLSNLAKSLDDEYCGEIGEIEDLLKQVRGE